MRARPDRDIRLGLFGRDSGPAFPPGQRGPGALSKRPIAGQDIPVPSAGKSQGSFTAPSPGHRPSRAGPMRTVHARLPVT